ncbi:MAG TPA: serine hydrolase [Bacteroidota bacterium]|nr:serine hydrolase [Bacteroidota bacterium]
MLISLSAVTCRPKISSNDQLSQTNTSFTPGPRPAVELIARAVDSLAARVIAEGLAPAIGVALVIDDRTAFSKSYGMADVTNGIPADDLALWYVASTSKSFTGFAISLLAQQGAIDFGTPVTTLLPHAQWPGGCDPGSLALANFLSHTHQLQDIAITMSAAYTGAFPESDWPAMIRYAAPKSGHDLIYSNFGYNVAAMVIDAKRPEGWRRYLDSAVYKPAGMTETYTRISGIDQHRIVKPHELRVDGGYVTSTFYKTDLTMNSAGGHLATLHDLARWVTVQLNGGVIDGKRVFPSDAVALSHRLIARQTHEESKRFAYFNREGWAAGWDVGSYRGQPMISRFGSYASTRSHLSFLPDRRIGVVVQTNGDLASQATDILAALAYDLEMGYPNARVEAANRLQRLIDRRPAVLSEIAKYDAKRASRQKPLNRPLSDFAGSYQHEWYGRITFEVRDNKLHYRWGALYGPAEVLDADGDVLRIEVVDEGISVAFSFPHSGPATSIELRNETFERQ